MQNLQNHIRNYELVERKCNELFEFLLVDDQKLSITTSGNLLVHIVQCIESLANSQNADPNASSLDGKASIPSTIQAEIEAAGAAFILLTVAKNLPLNKEKPYDQCDFTFDSDIFTATYTRPLFNCFAGPMSKDCLQFGPNWEKQLFVVKDPEPYIAHLRAKSKANEAQLLQEINKDSELVAFLHKAEEERPKTPTQLLIFEYGQQTGDQAKKKWCQRINNLSFSTNIEYFTAWANGTPESLKRAGFAPVGHCDPALT